MEIVQGAVSTPFGAFYSSFGDEGFGLQDSTAGISVSLPTNLNLGPTPTGKTTQAVRVTGRLENPVRLVEVGPARTSDATVEGMVAAVQPQAVSTGAVGNSNQGLLVRVCGQSTQAAGSTPACS